MMNNNDSCSHLFVPEKTPALTVSHYLFFWNTVFPSFSNHTDTLFDPGKSPHFSKDASEEMTSWGRGGVIDQPFVNWRFCTH